MSTTQSPFSIPPDLPQTGWHIDEFWASTIGESLDAFRKKVHQHRIPHMPWGLKMIVRAEDLWNYGPKNNAQAPPES